MPSPPTPVSGCPLKRLEIRDALTSRIFDSSQSFSSLTFTLEGQRPSSSEKGILVLLVHLGSQRVLTLRLTELLKLTEGPSDTITIDKQTRQLCIKIPEHNQTVVSWFEESRDFNVALCMLKKSGFHCKELDPQGPPQAAIRYQTSSSFSPWTGNNFAPTAPRLSDITPLRGLDAPPPWTPQDATSFTSMLQDEPMSLQPSNSPCSPGLSSPATLDQTPMAPFSQNTQQAARPASPFAVDPQLNPYHVFLNKQNSDFNRPRVSSPLRNSFRPERHFDTLPKEAFSQAISPTNADIPSHESLYTQKESGSPQSPFPIDSTLDFTDTSLSSNSLLSAPQDRTSSSSLSSPGVNQGRSLSNPSPSFRDMMPRRRDLPFIQRRNSETKKRAAAEVDSSGKGTGEFPEDFPPNGKKRKISTNQQVSKRNNSFENPDQSKESHSVVDTEVQTHNRNARNESTLPSHAFSKTTDAMSAVCVVDLFLLEQINTQTSKLFEQYEADVARGCKESAYALFYMDQIETARRAFWLQHLGQSGHVNKTAIV